MNNSDVDVAVFKALSEFCDNRYYFETPKVEVVFDEVGIELRKTVLEDDICVFAPDHNHKLILETDASNDGWGAILYQKINNKKRVIKMWSKAWKTEASNLHSYESLRQALTDGSEYGGKTSRKQIVRI